ncbi:ATP-binding protein [Kribbella catacumbae]|uniref:ATP-binding protein n=1 Tax=Kribbella catacumbae TaxID=460086 RepID=UPI00036A31E7|nr:AAA family ATPase [Kribbella catacumbae]
MEFVGRGPELRELADALDAARAGRGALVLLTGEAGIGKSATVGQFTAVAEQAGTAVARGRCLEGAARPAFQPWLQIQQALMGLGLIQADAWPIPNRAESFRGALLDDVTSALIRAAAGHDLTLVVEDVHDANRESALLLWHLAGQLPDSRLLVVATCRLVEARLRPEISDLVDDLSARAQVVALGALGEEEIGALLDSAGLQMEHAAPVLRRTAGNPLFVHTAIRLLSSGGGAGVEALEIPVSIRQAVRRQVALATAGCPSLPEFLEAAAVVGEEVGLAVMRHVYSADDLTEAADASVRAGLLTEVPMAVGRLAFPHALVRDTIYAGIAPGRRAALHAKVLAAGEILDPDEAAYHAVRAAIAGHAREAVGLASLAATRARSMYAFETAAAHLRNALDALDLVAPPDPLKRCDLLTDLAEVSGQAGDPAATRKHGLRAAEIAQRSGDLWRTARALLAASAQVPFLEHDDELLDLIGRCAGELGDEPSAERALLLARRAVLAAGRDDVAVLDRETAEAVRIAEQVGDKSLRFDVQAARMHALWGSPIRQGRVDDAARLVSAATTDDRRMQGHLWALHQQLVAADAPAARAELLAIEQVADRTGWGRHRLYALSRRATIQTMEGVLDLAAESVQRAHAVGLQAHEPEADAVRWGQLYAIAWHRDLDPLDLAFVEQVAHRSLGTPTNRVFSAALAVLCVRAGQLEQARTLFHDAMAGGVTSFPRDQHLPWLLALLAWLACALGDADAARDVDMSLAPYDGQALVVGCAVQWMGLVSHYRGIAAKAYGDLRTAAGRIEQARRTYEQIGARPWVVHAVRDLPSVAPHVTAQAEQAAERLGMRPRLPGHGPALVRDGEMWRLHNGTAELLLTDSLGLHYLDQLLRNPGREISAVTLAGLPEASVEDNVLDDRARREYRARLDELEVQLDQAGASNDLSAAQRAQSEKEALLTELRRATGLAGRSRKLGSSAEKARLNVTRALRSALERITALDPDLGRQLSSSVRTGSLCSYDPSRI